MLRNQIVIAESNGIIASVVETDSERKAVTNCGWGNGYISIPSTHPRFNDEDLEWDLNVHGGTTYNRVEGGRRILGFDTGHYNSDATLHDRAFVESETLGMLKALSTEPEDEAEQVKDAYAVLTEALKAVEDHAEGVDNNEDFDLALLRAKKSLKALLPFF